jgi:hypothetical protein
MERIPRRLGGLVTRETLPPPSGAFPHQQRDLLPSWQVTYLCDGREFVAVVKGSSATAATEAAACELAANCPDFDYDNARCVVCKQVR